MSPAIRYGATSLALAAIGTLYVLGQSWPDRPGPRPPAGPTAARPAPPVPGPTARDLVDRAAELSLTAEQVVRLEALARRWREESAELERALATAGERFGRFAGEAQAGTGASVEEIQRRSADYRELSAALREARRRHAEAAGAVLAEAERQRPGRVTPTDSHGGTP